MTKLEIEVEQFVADSLQHYMPWTNAGHGKIIHDAIWGTLPLSAAEIDIIDCPLVQRLRFVGQIGLAFFTFPSARHSRFEHSIGVMAMVTKMATALNQTVVPSDPLVSGRQLEELRLAALLHDVGHGFLSHISETMYEGHQWILDAKKRPEIAGAKAHEILSCRIVQSPAFRKFFDKLRLKHKSTDPNFASADLGNVAQLILGLYPEDPDGSIYLGDMLNGPFDADKLDYIARDAYFTGLTMSVDIERLLNTLRVSLDEDETGRKTRRLVTTLRGSTALEQVLLSKLRLYDVLYHHPKVRAADRMIGNIADYMSQHEGVLSDTREGDSQEDPAAAIVLHNPVDHLKHTDGDFLSLRAHKNPNLQRMIRSIRNRELPVKALVISSRTVTQRDAFLRLLRTFAFSSEAREGTKELQKKIYAEIPVEQKQGYIADDIIVDIPELPKLTEAPLMKVLSHDENGNEKLEILNQVTHVHDWCSTRMLNKWCGHVFSPPALQRATNSAAIQVFEREFKLLYHQPLTFNRLATTLANIHPTP